MSVCHVPTRAENRARVMILELEQLCGTIAHQHRGVGLFEPGEEGDGVVLSDEELNELDLALCRASVSVREATDLLYAAVHHMNIERTMLREEAEACSE